ncbi:MAG: GntR family transcriptional regulator [Treponema sp.]|jgi:DNA-binding LacI/PurR family transcriptional regulator|nr:GntR family transcriptional regulator [Treponema sp.]
MSKKDARLYYRGIYDYFIEQIASGKLSPGTRLPSEKELCQQFAVSRTTTKKALELLTEQNLIVRFPGKGSFVRDASEPPAQKPGRALRSMGFIIPDISDSFGVRLLNGIEQTCGSLGYHLILKKSRDSVDEEGAAINVLTEAGVDGLLIVPVHGEYYNPEILKLILNKTPLVFVDRKMRGLAVPSVSTDNAAAAALGTAYLVGLGHRHIAFYSGPIEDTSTVEYRRIGYIGALSSAKIPFDPELFLSELTSTWSFPYAPDRVRRDIALVRNHLEQHPQLTAAFVAEYNMALIVREAAESLGRTVPRDFSILCFDSPESLLGTVEFTHLAQDEYGIGQRAAETLQAIIAGAGNIPAGEILLPAELIHGATTERCI